MSGYPDSMFTLSLVSGRNLPLTATLVSTPLPSPLLPSLYRSKGHIYRGRVWCVNSLNARETVTQFLSRITVASIGMSSLPGMNGTAELHPQQYTPCKRRVFEAFTHKKNSRNITEYPSQHLWSSLNSGYSFHPRFLSF